MERVLVRVFGEVVQHISQLVTCLLQQIVRLLVILVDEVCEIGELRRASAIAHSGQCFDVVMSSFPGGELRRSNNRCAMPSLPMRRGVTDGDRCSVC